jgi:sRNA-binding regulator protein Hfq
MKESIDSMPVDRPIAEDGFANRKLIRPSLTRSDHNQSHGNHSPAPAERRERSMSAKKAPPPESTNAENFYYQKQMQARTPMVVVLRDGEEMHGIIEWYDRNCIKLIRSGQPNIMIYKPAIKYMYKESENSKR